MSEAFYSLLGQVDSHYPAPEVARSFVDKYVMMDAPAIHSTLVRLPMVKHTLPMLRDFVSDMERGEIAKELIASLDIHYHELLEEINKDEKKRALFRGTLSLVLDDLTGVAR